MQIIQTLDNATAGAATNWKLFDKSGDNAGLHQCRDEVRQAAIFCKNEGAHHPKKKIQTMSSVLKISADIPGWFIST